MTGGDAPAPGAAQGVAGVEGVGVIEEAAAGALMLPHDGDSARLIHCGAAVMSGIGLR